MSHLTRVQARIKDLDALEKAVKTMGLQLFSNTDCRYWNGKKEKKEYVIRLKGPYDVGLDRIPETEVFQLTTDWFGGYVAKEIGPDGETLLTEYAYEVAKKRASLMGYTIRKEVRNGKTEIVVYTSKGAKNNVRTALGNNLR